MGQTRGSYRSRNFQVSEKYVERHGSDIVQGIEPVTLPSESGKGRNVSKDRGGPLRGSHKQGRGLSIKLIISGSGPTKTPTMDLRGPT